MVYIHFYEKSLNQVRDLEHFEMGITNSKKSKNMKPSHIVILCHIVTIKKYKYGLHTFARKRLHSNVIS